MAIPKDFEARGIGKAKGTNKNNLGKEVWIVEGMGNFHGYRGTPQKKDGGRGWTNLGYEFETEADAKEFYKKWSKK